MSLNFDASNEENFEKFTTFEQIIRELVSPDYIPHKGSITKEDLEHYKPEVDRLLNSPFNKIAGLSMSEILEAVFIFKTDDAEKAKREQLAANSWLEEKFGNR